MKVNSKTMFWTGGKALLAVALLAGATGAAFAGWLNNADNIFLSLAEAGLAWCM